MWTNVHCLRNTLCKDLFTASEPVYMCAYMNISINVKTSVPKFNKHVGILHRQTVRSFNQAFQIIPAY
jgi:hypothetical protein